MGNADQTSRQNRTITVDFQEPSTYFELLSNGKVFVEFVLVSVPEIHPSASLWPSENDAVTSGKVAF